MGRGEKPRDGGSRCGAHLDAHLGSWTLVRAQWRKGGISSPSPHWEHERARDRTKLSGKPVFISTARYEPFGLAVLEAAQFGCALILSDIPTFRELWNGCAIFIDPDDDVSAAKAIDILIQNPDLRSHLGQQGDGTVGALFGGSHVRRGDGRLPLGAVRRLVILMQGSCRMRVVYFTHSLLSCWNHGNAHFLRGVLRELVHRGHQVTPTSRRDRGACKICSTTTGGRPRFLPPPFSGTCLLLISG